MFYRARYYNPSWGRFVSEDPIGVVGGVNLYGYVGENPISNKDPLGQDIASGIISGLTNAGLQVAENYAANGGDWRLALECIDPNAVMSAFVVGLVFPGAATTGVSLINYIFGSGSGQQALGNGVGFAIGLRKQ